MNAAATTTSSSMARRRTSMESLARTDEEYWQMFKRQMPQTKMKELEGPKTITSLKTDEWKKQLYVNYQDNRGKHRIIPLLSLSNSEEKIFLIKNFYWRFSSSVRAPQLKGSDWPELVVGSTFSTKIQEKRIKEKLEILLLAYAHEDFEDGMKSNFVRELEFHILKYGTEAIHAMAKIIARGRINPQVISEALRWLGCLIDPGSYQARLFLLERSLYHSSRWIRDGAALGLASMKDIRAIPYLREAIKREKIQDLREDIQVVLARLEHLL